MKKLRILTISLIFAVALVGCSTSSKTDYPAAIMVDDILYFLPAESSLIEVDESAIIGYTKSYTDKLPEKNGETNFSRELDMPYARVDDGIAVLYENEWYLCSPKDDTPFNVLIDKTVLEIGKENHTTVLIDTELTDWSYTAQAEYGCITNVGEKSFDYSIPKDKEQKQDTITIQFSDEEHKRTYEWVIPLRFPASSEEPIKGPLPVE